MGYGSSGKCVIMEWNVMLCQRQKWRGFIWTDVAWSLRPVAKWERQGTDHCVWRARRVSERGDQRSRVWFLGTETRVGELQSTGHIQPAACLGTASKPRMMFRSLVAQRDPVLSLQGLASLQWCVFSLWPGTFHMLQVWPTMITIIINNVHYLVI